MDLMWVYFTTWMSIPRLRRPVTRRWPRRILVKLVYICKRLSTKRNIFKGVLCYTMSETQINLNTATPWNLQVFNILICVAKVPLVLISTMVEFDIQSNKDTLQGTNISPKNGILKLIFLFSRWDMLVPWRVTIFCCDLYTLHLVVEIKNACGCSSAQVVEAWGGWFPWFPTGISLNICWLEDGRWDFLFGMVYF